MMIKLDLEKAYDRLNWNFLRDNLFNIGLTSSWINLIMSCTQSNELQLMCNGSKVGSVRPSKRIRQGDHMLSHLFVLCIERLSHMIF